VLLVERDAASGRDQAGGVGYLIVLVAASLRSRRRTDSSLVTSQTTTAGRGDVPPRDPDRERKRNADAPLRAAAGFGAKLPGSLRTAPGRVAPRITAVIAGGTAVREEEG
jgi:hypothetical protein